MECLKFTRERGNDWSGNQPLDRWGKKRARRANLVPRATGLSDNEESATDVIAAIPIQKKARGPGNEVARRACHFANR